MLRGNQTERVNELDPEANKQSAIESYRTAYMGDPVEAVRRSVGAEYIHRNPGDGDLIALHTHQV